VNYSFKEFFSHLLFPSLVSDVILQKQCDGKASLCFHLFPHSLITRFEMSKCFVNLFQREPDSRDSEKFMSQLFVAIRSCMDEQVFQQVLKKIMLINTETLHVKLAQFGILDLKSELAF